MPPEQESVLAASSDTVTTPPSEGDAPAQDSPPTPESVDQVPSDWKTLSHHIPDALKDDETLKRFNTAGDLSTAYIDLRKKMGRSVSVPTGDSTKEEIDEFYNRLGRPDSAEVYKLPEMDMPDGITTTEDSVKWFKDTVHKLGLSQLQAENFYREYHSKLREDHEKTTKEAQDYGVETIENLKKEWGPSYTNKTEAASRAFHQLLGEEAVEYLDEIGAGNEPVLIKAFYALSQKIGGDSVRGTTGDQSIIEQKTLREQRTELLNKPEYWSDPDLQEKAAKLNELIAAKDA